MTFCNINFYRLFFSFLISNKINTKTVFEAKYYIHKFNKIPLNIYKCVNTNFLKQSKTKLKNKSFMHSIYNTNAGKTQDLEKYSSLFRA